MKKTIIFLSILLFFSCKTKVSDSKKETNKVIENKEENINIIGYFDRNELQKNPYALWFDENYKNYDLDELTAKKIKPLIKNFEITVFMGTWCEESQKDIPGFFKLYDYIKADNDKIQLIGMSEQKTTPQNYEKGLEIFNVPTYIFKKNGKEINRIVEFPVETLEKDIFKILSGQEYKNIYADF